MSRRRYVQMSEPPYDLVEVSDSYVPEPRAVNNALAGDRHYDGLRAVDGADISTRSKHREYMKRHGLTTADDFTQSWAKAEKARNEYRITGKGGAVTRDDIGRAIHQLESKR